MPEIVTKYPDVVLSVLKSGGGKCGAGMKQQILKNCPADHFCSFPQGEICVYGLNNIETMTQIRVDEFSDLAKSVPTIYSNTNIILLAISCLFGIIMGYLLNKTIK